MQTFPRLDHAGIMEILALMNVVHTGHFVGTSGAHLDTYINKDAPGSHPLHLMHLAHELAYRISGFSHLESDDVIALVGAPMGAISLGAFTAYWLNTLFPRGDGEIVQSFYAEKTSLTDDKAPFKLRQYYADQLKGRGAIAIEDIINSGGSAQKTIDIIKASGGEPIGVGALCNRGGVTPEKLNIRFITSLADLNLQKWDVHKDVPCELCQHHVSIRTDLGHGAKFVAKHGQP